MSVALHHLIISTHISHPPPIPLAKPNRTVDRLVYAPHIYGPSVYEHGYMREPDFPGNLPAVCSAYACVCVCL